MRTQLSLEMYVKSGNGQFSINKVLVQRGLAEVVDDDTAPKDADQEGQQAKSCAQGSEA